MTKRNTAMRIASRVAGFVAKHGQISGGNMIRLMLHDF
jgi:hypothetical protein